MADDPYNIAGRRPELGTGSTLPFAVVPADGADLPRVSRYLYVGGGGEVVMTTIGGVGGTHKAVPTGGYIMAACARVKATGTTATYIVGHA